MSKLFKLNANTWWAGCSLLVVWYFLRGGGGTSINHSSLSLLTSSRNPPPEQGINFTWQYSWWDDCTQFTSPWQLRAYMGDGKNGNNVSSWFYAWTACCSLLLIWIGESGLLLQVGFLAVNFGPFKSGWLPGLGVLYPECSLSVGVRDVYSTPPSLLVSHSLPSHLPFLIWRITEDKDIA